MSYSLLLAKLADIGFDDRLVSFFESYLSNRVQYVEYMGHRSKKFIATSGAPQGSNLAPLLFSLFLNDICGVVRSNILIFADDIKIFRRIRDRDDWSILQGDLENIHACCISNRLPLNISKCKYMLFTRNKRIKTYSPYSLNGTPLTRVSDITDLGVVFDEKLSFIKHIDHICNSSMKLLGLIFRTCRSFSDINALKMIYFSYVRSKLEYCSIVWNPIYKNHTQKIEKIQRKFLKYLCFKVDGIYPEQGIENYILCNRFDVKSLSCRRKFLAIQFLHKLCVHNIDCASILAQLNFKIPRLNSRSSELFLLPTPKTNLLVKAPVYHITVTFNFISKSIDINEPKNSKFKCDLLALIDLL